MQNKILILLTFISGLLLTACNNIIGGSGGNNSDVTTTGITYVGNHILGKDLEKPLKAEVIEHTTAGMYVNIANTSMYSMIKITNDTGENSQITDVPKIRDSVNFSIITNPGYYPSGATICHNNKQLGEFFTNGSSCYLLIKANNTASSKTGDTISTALTIQTGTYIYSFKITKNPILYLAGNFANVVNKYYGINAEGTTHGSDTFSVSPRNSQGSCGASENRPCLIVSYNTATHMVRKIAETNDEVNALAVDKAGYLYVGGEFVSVAFPSLALAAVPGTTNATTMIAKINPVDKTGNIYAMANQAVYSIATSPQDSSYNSVYISGALTKLYNGGQLSTPAISSVGDSGNSCLIARDDGSKWNNSGEADGFISSMATANQDNLEHLLLSGSFEKLNNSLIDVMGGASVGVMDCILGKDCNQSAPIQFNARSNVVAVTDENKILTSGDYKQINGQTGQIPVNHGDFEISNSIASLGNVKWSKVNTTSADVAIHAISTTSDSYYLGGSFSVINNLVQESSTLANCGANSKAFCVLARVSKDTGTTEKIIETDSHINAIAEGITLSIEAPTR